MSMCLSTMLLKDAFLASVVVTRDLVIAVRGEVLTLMIVFEGLGDDATAVAVMEVRAKRMAANFMVEVSLNVLKMVALMLTDVASGY